MYEMFRCVSRKEEELAKIEAILCNSAKFFAFSRPDIAIDMSYDQYSCIGGQGWYWVRFERWWE